MPAMISPPPSPLKKEVVTDIGNDIHIRPGQDDHMRRCDKWNRRRQRWNRNLNLNVDLCRRHDGKNKQSHHKNNPKEAFLHRLTLFPDWVAEIGSTLYQAFTPLFHAALKAETPISSRDSGSVIDAAIHHLAKTAVHLRVPPFLRIAWADRGPLKRHCFARQPYFPFLQHQALG